MAITNRFLIDDIMAPRSRNGTFTQCYFDIYVVYAQNSVSKIAASFSRLDFLCPDILASEFIYHVWHQLGNNCFIYKAFTNKINFLYCSLILNGV